MWLFIPLRLSVDTTTLLLKTRARAWTRETRRCQCFHDNSQRIYIVRCYNETHKYWPKTTIILSETMSASFSLFVFVGWFFFLFLLSNLLLWRQLESTTHFIFHHFCHNKSKHLSPFSQPICPLLKLHETLMYQASQASGAPSAPSAGMRVSIAFFFCDALC